MASRRSLGPEREQTPEQRLRQLALRLSKELLVVSGTTPEAEQQNKAVMVAVSKAIKQTDPAELYGITIWGSRVKGCNNMASDLDVVMIGPATSTVQHVYDTILEELNQRGTKNIG